MFDRQGGWGGRTMTTRQQQAAALALALTTNVGVTCRMELHTGGELGGGWRVHWSDGPTVNAMYAALAEHASPASRSRA